MASSKGATCSDENKYEWKTEQYSIQKTLWPVNGKHILAQYDEDTVVVYQAYKPSIAEYAVLHQRFGGPQFNFGRMSWIKTNFLWMMYRCGWATKKDQERVLAVRISREGFDNILANACSAYFQKSKGIQHIEVRLQWDPDHSPSYVKQSRRAIQLGLKGTILEKYGTEWIVSITDVTEFSKKQYQIFLKEGEDSENFFTASERIYPVENLETVHRIDLDSSKGNVPGDQATEEVQS